MALEKVVLAERKASIGALKAMYFLNKRDCSHYKFYASPGFGQISRSNIPQ